MARKKKIQFQVNTEEYQILTEYASLRNVSMAEVLREYVKTIPRLIEKLKKSQLL
jgi:hypothetical protein